MKPRNWYGNPSPMTDDDWGDFWDFVDRLCNRPPNLGALL
jgi:hypothetical protein